MVKHVVFFVVSMKVPHIPATLFFSRPSSSHRMVSSDSSVLAYLEFHRIGHLRTNNKTTNERTNKRKDQNTHSKRIQKTHFNAALLFSEFKSLDVLDSPPQKKNTKTLGVCLPKAMPQIQLIPGKSTSDPETPTCCSGWRSAPQT